MINLIIIVISIFLDIFLNINLSVLIFPMFTVCLIITNYLLIKNELIYFILNILLGLFLDIIYIKQFPINTYIFLLLSFINYHLFLKCGVSYIKTILFTLVTIFLYDFILFINYAIFNIGVYSITLFLTNFVKSLIINFIYISFIYYIFKCQNKSYKNYIKY